VARVGVGVYWYRYGAPGADIEILEVCPATLWRREATTKQWGFVPALGESGYDLKRAGILGWTAIDAQCPAPTGHVRFQAERQSSICVQHRERLRLY